MRRASRNTQREGNFPFGFTTSATTVVLFPSLVPSVLSLFFSFPVTFTLAVHLIVVMDAQVRRRKHSAVPCTSSFLDRRTGVTKTIFLVFFLLVTLAGFFTSFMALGVGATAVRYHGTVYRGLDAQAVQEGGETFTVTVSVPTFPLDNDTLMRQILLDILSHHVFVIDSQGFPLQHSFFRAEESAADGMRTVESIEDEQMREALAAPAKDAWMQAVAILAEKSTYNISADRETLFVQFAPVPLSISTDVSLIIVPCLPFALFEQLGEMGMADLPHNCLSGDGFIIRHHPFPKVDKKDLTDTFFVTGKPIEIPINLGHSEVLVGDHASTESALRVVEGSTCLHSRNAVVRGSTWDAHQKVFRFVPHRGGTHSICYAPFFDALPLLQLKMMESIEIAGPEGVSTEPPQVRAKVEFMGTIFGSNFSTRDTAVITEELCTDFNSQNVYFVELQYITAFRMSFAGTFQKRGIYHLCYHREGSPAYVRISTLLVEKDSEVVVDSDAADLLIDQDMKLLTSASVQKLKVQNGGKLVLKQKSLNIQSFFMWSGGAITGHGLLNVSGYGRITTEGYETREVRVPFYNYGDLTVDVQRLSLDQEGCIHNFGNLTLSLSSMGEDGISSALSVAERNAIFNYAGGRVRIFALHDRSFALLTNKFVLTGGVSMIAGTITLTDFSNGVDSLVIVKRGSSLTLLGARVSGRFHIEENAVVHARDGTVFIAAELSGDGVVLADGDGVVFDSTNFTGSLTFVLRSSTKSAQTIGVYNVNYFGPQTTVIADRLHILTGSNQSIATFDGAFIADVGELEITGAVTMVINSCLVMYRSHDEKGNGRYIQDIVLNPEAQLFVLDLANPVPVSENRVEYTRCPSYAVSFAHMTLMGETYLRGCLVALMPSEIGGRVAPLEYNSTQWETLTSRFCTGAVLEFLPDFCRDLDDSATREMPYNGIRLSSEVSITQSALITVDELLVFRGMVIVTHPITITVTDHIIIFASRFLMQRGGVLDSPLVRVAGLLDIQEPTLTELTGQLRLQRDCFIRLHGVPRPCDRYLKVTGGAVAEEPGEEVYHCVGIKYSESNFTDFTSLTNLPSNVACRADLLQHMVDQRRIFFVRGFSPTLDFNGSLTRGTLLACLLVLSVSLFLMFRTLLYFLGVSFSVWKEDFVKPSPLRLTLTWDEFRTKPFNYIVVLFFVVNCHHSISAPFHPSLSVPFPYISRFSLRNIFLVMPLYVMDRETPLQVSYFVIAWSALTAISLGLKRFGRDSFAKKVLGVSLVVELGMSFFVNHISSVIADGIACSTLLRDNPVCHPFREAGNLPVECLALFLFAVGMGRTRVSKELGRHFDFQLKSTFVIVWHVVFTLRVALWKVFYYHPVWFVHANLACVLLLLALTLYVSPTPYTNINRLVTLNSVIQVPVYIVIYFYELRLHFGYVKNCDDYTLLFVAVFLITVVGAVYIFMCCIVYADIPEDSVGDPFIDALRRSISQIRTRIEDVKHMIPSMASSLERENASNALSRLRVELLERQEQYNFEINKLLYPFFYGEPYVEEDMDTSEVLSRTSTMSSSSISGSNYLSLEEMESFSCGPQLGSGSYGTVYLGILSTGKLVAVKYINVATAKSNVLQSVKSEVEMLIGLKHPNIIRYYGAHSMGGTMMIFMEFAVGGSLASILRKFSVLSEPVMQLYTFQILSGLQFLHHRNVVHRDIKGENILIDGDGVSKLADFGACKALADIADASQAGCGTLVGSPFWMAPEVIRSEAYGTKADIWSVGCTVVEMLNGGEPPWRSNFENAYSAMYYVGSTTDIPAIPEETSERCRHFLHRCFERDVSKRATAEELLQHEWLADVPSRNRFTADLSTDSGSTPSDFTLNRLLSHDYAASPISPVSAFAESKKEV